MIPEPLFYAAVGYAVAFVVGYVWMGLTLGAVYRKFGARPARAWIPVLRYAELATLTQSGTAGVIAVRSVAGVGAVTSIAGVLLGSEAGDALAIGGLGVAGVAALAAWILWILHVHRLGLDHALSAGYTVLGAVLPWAWSAVVGWGRAGAATATGPIPLVTARAVAMTDDEVPAGPAPVEEAPADTMPTETVPADPVPTDTVPIAVRRSPYASLAPRDADPAPLPVRRSPFADLAAPDHPALAPEPAPTTPTFLVVPPLPPPATEDLPVAEPADQAPTEPVARVEEAPETADLTDVELASAVDPAPWTDPVPSGPVSPYMRGGAAAPPAAPSIVPSFALPDVLEPEPAVAADPEPEPEPAAEPAATTIALPAPVADPASSTPQERISLPPAEPIAPPPPTPPRVEEEPAATLEPAPGDGSPAWAGGAVFPGMAGAAAATAPPTDQDAAEDDRTQVAARVRERWELVTAEGRAYPLTPPAVLVGRPGGFPPLDGTPRVDIDDTTRTVSKSHARLALDQGRWTVEDLGSTNGTYLIDALGRETQVAPGQSREIDGRLAFGDVELELRRRDGA